MGGYRTPANPAPVSGPGALSQRTDGQPAMQLPDAAYGEQAAFQEAQAGAPMAMEPMVRPSGPPPAGLMDPTQRPDEPVTAGAALGAGPGPEVLQDREAAVREMGGLDRYMPMMEKMAARDDAPRAFRALVQYVKAFNG